MDLGKNDGLLHFNIRPPPLPNVMTAQLHLTYKRRPSKAKVMWAKRVKMWAKRVVWLSKAGTVCQGHTHWSIEPQYCVTWISKLEKLEAAKAIFIIMIMILIMMMITMTHSGNNAGGTGQYVKWPVGDLRWKNCVLQAGLSRYTIYTFEQLISFFSQTRPVSHNCCSQLWSQMEELCSLDNQAGLSW